MALPASKSIIIYLKKLFKRIFILFAAIAVIFTLAVAVIINFILTPEKITPAITHILNENLQAKVTLDRAELTFFSSFPKFGLKVANGSIVSTGTADTLVQFKNCELTVNAEKLYLKHDLIIDKLSINDAVINAIVDQNGKPNWLIYDEEPQALPTGGEDAFTIRSIILNGIAIKNAQLSFRDHSNNSYAAVKNFNLSLQASRIAHELKVALTSEGQKITITKDGYSFAKNLQAGLTTEILVDTKKHSARFSKSSLQLNGIDFSADGTLQRNPSNNEVSTDFALALKVPSLADFWKMIPKRVLKEEDVTVQGTVQLTSIIKGIYGKNKIPSANVALKINDGVVKYKNFPGEIRHLEADMLALINYGKPEQSYLTVNKFLLDGTGVDIKATGNIVNLLKEPSVSVAVKGTIDLTMLKKKFPVAKQMDIRGTSMINITTSFNSNEIARGNYANLSIDGKIDMKDFAVSIPQDSISFKTNRTAMLFNRDNRNGKLNTAGVTFENLEVGYKSYHQVSCRRFTSNLTIKKLEGSLGVHASSQVAGLRYKGTCVSASAQNAQIAASLRPGGKWGGIVLNSIFTIDSAALWQGKNFVGIKNGSYKITAQKGVKGRWHPEGHVEFHSLRVSSPEIGLPLHMAHSKIAFDSTSLRLDNARITMGNSDAVLTGRISNLFPDSPNGRKIIASLTLHSKFIDANQLTGILAQDTAAQDRPRGQTIANNGSTSSDTPPSVVVIPSNIDLSFASSIDKLRFGALDFKDIRGKINVKDGHLFLDQVQLKTLAATLTASIDYSAASSEKARIGFRFDLLDIEMKNISELMPAIDNLLPMAKSFVGTGLFKMRGTAVLDSEMSLMLPSLRAIAVLQAQDIMVLDSEAYRELAKTFLFKDKKVNTIQNLSMEMIVDNSRVEILPALVEIDRYRLAVGGLQNFDLSYDYHVSVLKSPIPFKTGVDIRGKAENFKISFSKAKYKYYFTDNQRLQNKADSIIIKKKNLILGTLKLI